MCSMYLYQVRYLGYNESRRTQDARSVQMEGQVVIAFMFRFSSLAAAVCLADSNMHCKLEREPICSYSPSRPSI